MRNQIETKSKYQARSLTSWYRGTRIVTRNFFKVGLAFNLGILASTTLLNGLLNLISAKMLVSLFGPTQFGSFSAAQSLISTSCVIFASINLTVMSSISSQTGESRPIQSTVCRPKKLQPIVVCVGLGVVWVLASPITSNLVDAPTRSMLPLVIVIPVVLVVAVIDGAIYGVGRFAVVQALSVLSTLVNLAMICGFSVFDFRDVSMAGLLALSSTPSILVGALFLSKTGRLRKAFRSANLGAHSISYILFWMCIRAGVIFAPSVLGPRDSSSFALIFGVHTLVIMTTVPLVALLLPRFNREGIEKRIRLLSTVTFSIGISLPLSIIISWKAESILGLLFGSQFVDNAGILRWSIFSTVAWSGFVSLIQIEIGLQNSMVLKYLSIYVCFLLVSIQTFQSLSAYIAGIFFGGVIGVVSLFALLARNKDVVTVD